MCGRLMASQMASAEFSGPVVGAATGLHADLTTGLEGLTQHPQPVSPRQPAFEDTTACLIDPMYLKDVLCQIHTNASNLHDGLLLIL
jgi:hypothetical protein